MMDLQFLEKLMELLNSSNAAAIEVKKNWWSTTVRISKTGLDFGTPGAVTYQVGNPVSPPMMAAASAAPAAPAAPPPAAGAAEAAESGESVSPPSQLVEIKSPMVGTFYAQPEPGAEPYVRVGSRITPGQTLCIIEAMKIMNPIDAEIGGVITEVCVQDAQPVEYGQVLFRVDPHG